MHEAESYFFRCYLCGCALGFRGSGGMYIHLLQSSNPIPGPCWAAINTVAGLDLMTGIFQQCEFQQCCSEATGGWAEISHRVVMGESEGSQPADQIEHCVMKKRIRNGNADHKPCVWIAAHGIALSALMAPTSRMQLSRC